MKLADADLVRGQTPGLSALVTQIHTHALRWGAHLLWACQRLPSFPVGVYVCCWWGRGGSRWEYWWIMLQVMRWVMMGTETQAASNLFICALLSYNFLNYLSHSWGDKTSHSGLGVKAETHECIHTLWCLRCSQISLSKTISIQTAERQCPGRSWGNGESSIYHYFSFRLAHSVHVLLFTSGSVLVYASYNSVTQSADITLHIKICTCSCFFWLTLRLKCHDRDWTE